MTESDRGVTEIYRGVTESDRGVTENSSDIFKCIHVLVLHNSIVFWGTVMQYGDTVLNL